MDSAGSGGPRPSKGGDSVHAPPRRDGIINPLLSMLLESGADGNQIMVPTEYQGDLEEHPGRSTSWRLFLERFQREESPHASIRLGASHAGRMEFFSDPHVQRAMKALLEYGADLQPAVDPKMWDKRDPLATLKQFLPRDSDLYDWAAILEGLRKQGVEHYGTKTSETKPEKHRTVGH